MKLGAQHQASTLTFRLGKSSPGNHWLPLSCCASHHLCQGHFSPWGNTPAASILCPISTNASCNIGNISRNILRSWTGSQSWAPAPGPPKPINEPLQTQLACRGEKKLSQLLLPTSVCWRKLKGQTFLPTQCNGSKNNLKVCLQSRAVMQARCFSC